MIICIFFHSILLWTRISSVILTLVVNSFSCCLQYNGEDGPHKGTRYSAVASYTALENTEVSFQEGDVLELLRVGQEGWWFARHTVTALEGWVPASYLELQ